MAGHYLSGELVLKESWDVTTGAIRIIPSENTQFAIELDAADGDSVLAVNSSSTLTEGTYNAKGMKTVCLYGTGQVFVSPVDDAEEFYELTVTALVPVSICASRVRLVGAGKLVMQSV